MNWQTSEIIPFHLLYILHLCLQNYPGLHTQHLDRELTAVVGIKNFVDDYRKLGIDDWTIFIISSFDDYRKLRIDDWTIFIIRSSKLNYEIFEENVKEYFNWTSVVSKVGGIASSTGQNFNLSEGVVARAILTKAGPAIQSELTQRKPANYQYGEVVTTCGYGLGCQFVYHGVCLKWNNGRNNSEKV